MVLVSEPLVTVHEWGECMGIIEAFFIACSSNLNFTDFMFLIRLRGCRDISLGGLLRKIGIRYTAFM